MKKLLSLLFVAASIAGFAQSTDAELTDQANIIKNETTAGANTANRVGQMFLDIIASKVNNSNLTWDEVLSKPTTLAGFGITDGVNTSRMITVNGESHNLSSNPTFTVDAVPTTRTVNGHALSANVTVTKADVGLGSADDTSDANKPISTPTQTALDLKANKAYAFNTQTDNYTLALADANSKVVVMNKATAVNVTVPANGTIAFDVGTTITIKRLGAGAITFVQDGGVTITATSGSLTGPEVNGYSTLIKTATNTWDLLNGANPTWTDFVPTFTGFSTPPTVSASRYILNGKMCTYYIRCSSGASNATTYTQTLPFAAANTGIQFAYGHGFSSAAFLTTPAMILTRVGSNIADLYTAANATAWLNNGNPKSVDFTIVYEIQ